MKARFGITCTGKALDWLASYQSHREQCVSISGTPSGSESLYCNVPQGLVLGPKLVIDYESPLGSIIRKHGVEAHFYADDSQIYIVFTPDERDDATEVHSGGSQWIGHNFLKFNDAKNELILLGSYHNLSKVDEIETAIGESETFTVSS